MEIIIQLCLVISVFCIIGNCRVLQTIKEIARLTDKRIVISINEIISIQREFIKSFGLYKTFLRFTLSQLYKRGEKGKMSFIQWFIHLVKWDIKKYKENKREKQEIYDIVKGKLKK